MDTLFHGVLGATLCSRTGLAGGRRGPGPEFKRRWLFSDWTLWAAFFFGIVPDLASLGIHFMMDAFTGNGVRWHGIPDFIFLLWPFSDWGFAGWSWWIHPRVFFGGWILVGVLWLVVIVLRLARRKT